MKHVLITPDKLTKEQVKSFQELFAEKYHINLTEEEAISEAMNLLELVVLFLET